MCLRCVVVCMFVCGFVCVCVCVCVCDDSLRLITVRKRKRAVLRLPLRCVCFLLCNAYAPVIAP